MELYTREIIETILQYIDEGIQIIDHEGKTILYNCFYA